ncbi:MAG: hypothetical protein AAGE76_01840 [Pseudomonadota bacterium]
MIGRFVGALIRALALVIVIASPAFLLPDVSRASQEITLIIAGIAAAFTLFEYASTHPGLIDFRFAPPYNRVRFIAFTVQILSVVFICRADAGSDLFATAVLGMADRAVAMTSFPLSPVDLAVTMIAGDSEASLQLLIRRAAAISVLVTFLFLAAFGVFLWIVRWPVVRRDFNLWINLPTFEPGYGRDVERRLYRDGFVNMLVGVGFLYLLPVLLSQSFGWFDPAVLRAYQPLVWGTTFWTFLSGSLVIRGAAILKVAWLVRRSRQL